MSRRTMRTKSGRLTRRERRRRLRDAEPGAIVILDSQGRINRRGARTRGTRCELVVAKGQDLHLDLDMRKLVEVIALRLMQHFRTSLLAGVDPTGKRLPALKRKGEGRTFGVQTGRLAEGWTLGNVRGAPSRAKVVVFPVRDEIRAAAIRKWLTRKVDRVEVMGIRGNAEKVIADAVSEWMTAAVGGGVATPARPLSRGWLELRELEATARW